jgi:putative FmdB family regulatory protein
MAIYEYRCEKCGNVLQVLEYGPEDKPRACPDCGGTRLIKMISSPAVITKGHTPRGGTTCCGSQERCDTPPCSDGGTCRR